MELKPNRASGIAEGAVPTETPRNQEITYTLGNRAVKLELISKFRNAADKKIVPSSSEDFVYPLKIFMPRR